MLTVFGGSLPFARLGLIDSPTAEILQHTQIGLGGTLAMFGVQNADSLLGSSSSYAGHLDIGVFNVGQIGITWLGEAGISGQVKVLLLHESLTSPALAIGCQNITSENDYEFYRSSDDSLYHYGESQNFSGYIVMTKNLDNLLELPVLVNLGYGIGRFRQAEYADWDAVSNPFIGLFTAIEYHPNQEFSVSIEWDGRDANLGFCYEPLDYLQVMAGIAELEQLVPSDDTSKDDVMQNTKLAVGINITFPPLFHRTELIPLYNPSRTNSDWLIELEERRTRAKEDITNYEEFLTEFE